MAYWLHCQCEDKQKRRIHNGSVMLKTRSTSLECPIDKLVLLEAAVSQEDKLPERDVFPNMNLQLGNCLTNSTSICLVYSLNPPFLLDCANA